MTMTNPEHMPSDDAMENRHPSPRGISDLNTPLFLRNHLFADQRGYLALFSGARGDDPRKLLARAERYFSWPDEAGSAVERALAESSRGRESYFCAHLLTGTTPVSEHGCSSSAVTQRKPPGPGAAKTARADLRMIAPQVRGRWLGSVPLFYPWTIRGPKAKCKRKTPSSLSLRPAGSTRKIGKVCHEK